MKAELEKAQQHVAVWHDEGDILAATRLAVLPAGTDAAPRRTNSLSR